MTRRPSPLMLIGIVLLSLNLFPAAVSVGPVLSQVRSGLGLNDWQVAALTAVPLLAFAVVRALSATAARVFGVHRAALISVLLIAIGSFARSLADQPWVFVLLTALAVSGSAGLAPLLPLLTRIHYPNRVSSVTAIYTMAAAVATMLAVGLTLPVSHGEGGWRTALAIWGALAVLAAVPWLHLVRHDSAYRAGKPDLSGFTTLRTPLGWALSVSFGLQTAQVFTVILWFPTFWYHHGFTPAQAGFLVAIATAVPIPLALFVPAAAMWRRDPRPVAVATLLSYPLAYAGLLLHPHGAAPLCALLLGIGAVGTPVLLVLVGLRSPKSRSAMALVSATQSVGYVVAAACLFGFGILRHLSQGWDVGLVALLGITAVQLLLTWYVGRPRRPQAFVEG